LKYRGAGKRAFKGGDAVEEGVGVVAGAYVGEEVGDVVGCGGGEQFDIKVTEDGVELNDLAGDAGDGEDGAQVKGGAGGATDDKGARGGGGGDDRDGGLAVECAAEQKGKQAAEGKGAFYKGTGNARSLSGKTWAAIKG